MRLLFATVLFFSAMSAKADVIFTPAFSYDKQDDTDKKGPNTYKPSERTTYDLRLGYLSPSGLYVGGMYSILKNDKFSGFSVAPTIGFESYSGFYAMFSYHLMGDMTYSDTEKYTGGMGPQIDLGWVFPLTSMFFLGPQITYRSINYKKVEVSGTSTDADFTRASIMPYIVLWFRF